MIPIKKEISGFVLAGGKSSRMGKDKGLIDFNGKQMIEYSIQALKEVCSSIYIISNNTDYNSFGYPVLSDLVKEKGPLAGICTALSISKTDLNVMVTCDSPYISSALLSHLLEQSKGYEAVVPSYKAKLYPLTAVYTKACYATLSKRLAEDKLAVKSALEFVKTKQVQLSTELPFFDEKMMANMNTLKELEIHED